MSLIQKIKNWMWRHSSDYRCRLIGERVYDLAEPWPKDDLMQPPMDAQTALDELQRYFLGMDYQIINPINTEQANSQVIYDIMCQYRGDPTYFKELRKHYESVQKRKE